MHTYNEDRTPDQRIVETDNGSRIRKGESGISGYELEIFKKFRKTENGIPDSRNGLGKRN